jgi:hypothetical protein
MMSMSTLNQKCNFSTVCAYTVFTEKINIPPFNNEDQRPTQQHHVTVSTVLIQRAAVILAKKHGQIYCTMDWYFLEKTGKCPFNCCLFSSVIMHFVSHTNFWFTLGCVCKEFHPRSGPCHGSNGSWLSNTVWNMHKHKHSPL